MIEAIKKSKVIVILRNIDPDLIIPCAQALYDGGIRLIEVAANSTAWQKEIEMLRRHFNESMLIGAGTMLNTADVRQALDSGAEFLLSPSSDNQVLEYCAANAISFLPGVLTPSDISHCMSYGFNTMKMFPAGDMPINYAASMKGPFANSEYVAVGGVSKLNAHEYIDAGYIGVGIGSNLISNRILANHDWDDLRQDTSELTHRLDR